MVRPLSSSGWHAMSGLVMKTGFIVQQIEGLHHMAEKAKKEAAKIVRMGFIGYGIQGRTVLVPHFIKQEHPSRISVTSSPTRTSTPSASRFRITGMPTCPARP